MSTQRGEGGARRRQVGADHAPQGAARRRAHPRPARPRGADDARVHRARRRPRDRQAAALGRRERRGESQPDRRRPDREDRVRGRGADDQALASTRPRPRRPDSEADVPHHDHAGAGDDGYSDPSAGARAAGRGEAEAGSAPQGRAEGEGRDEAEAEAKTEAKTKAEAKPKAAAKPKPPTRRPRRRTANGSKSSPRRHARRRHPRLEVELVRRHEGVPGGAARGHQDPRAHLQQALPCGPVRRAHPQGQAADHDRHLHGAPRDRDRQVRRRGRRAAQRDPRDDAQERAHQHQRDQAPRAGREARRAVDRGAAPEPRQLPARDEALARVGDALRRPRREGPVRRPARRHRDEPLRELLRGPRAAAHDPRGHRLRLRRGEDDLRPDRREGLDQQGRDHARGLRERRPAEGDAARRPGHGAPPRRAHRGPLRLTGERTQQVAGPRGSRPRRVRDAAARKRSTGRGAKQDNVEHAADRRGRDLGRGPRAARDPARRAAGRSARGGRSGHHDHEEAGRETRRSRRRQS